METLIKQAEDFVTQYLNDHLDANFVYHNLAHTQRVVNKTKELTEESDIADTETFDLSPDIFDDPRLRSFVDFTEPTLTYSVGRANPFAQTTDRRF